MDAKEGKLTKEERGDIRLAVIVVIVAFFLGFFTRGAWACESFERCMEDTIVTESGWEDKSHEKVKRDRLTAIALKLEEISRKLDNRCQSCFSVVADTEIDDRTLGVNPANAR